MPARRINVTFVLPVLIAALLAPILCTGWFSLNRAGTEFNAGDFTAAAESYSRAARLLPWRNDLWEKAGIAAARGGDATQALDLFQRAPSLSAEGWLWFGYSQYEAGDLASSIHSLKESLRLAPQPSAYELLAFIYRSQKDWAAERSTLEDQLRRDPESMDVHLRYRLGVLLTVLEPGQALTHLMFASSLDPKLDPAVQTLRSALNLSATQPDASQQMVTVGRALGLVQEWELAIAAFERAISLDGENAEAWAWLGEAKQQIAALPKKNRDDVSESKGEIGLTELDKAALLDHTSVVVRGLRALYWGRHGKYKQMLAEYSLAAMYEPTNPAWQAGLGDAYIKTGDLASALAAYQKAATLAPNEPTYWVMLAVFCAENGVYLEGVGLPAAQKAVEVSPDDPSALDALGQVYLASGRYASAEQTLLDVTQRFPAYLSAHIHLAITYLAQGNPPAAHEALIQVQSADPNGAYGQMAGQLLKQYFP